MLPAAVSIQGAHPRLWRQVFPGSLSPLSVQFGRDHEIPAGSIKTRMDKGQSTHEIHGHVMCTALGSAVQAMRTPTIGARQSLKIKGTKNSLFSQKTAHQS
jgi:hypothetical protein